MDAVQQVCEPGLRSKLSHCPRQVRWRLGAYAGDCLAFKSGASYGGRQPSDI